MHILAAAHWTLVALFMLALLAATRSYAAGPILIGVSAPSTGDTASSRQEAMNGAELAVVKLNYEGGILGRPVQLLEGDDRRDRKDAAIVPQNFVASGDLGPVFSKIPASRYNHRFIHLQRRATQRGQAGL